jgi:predicted nucleotidyltransferase
MRLDKAEVIADIRVEEALTDIVPRLELLGVEWAIVGSVAWQLLDCSGVARELCDNTDVDIAVRVNVLSEFITLRKLLLKTQLYEEVPFFCQRLLFKNGVYVDFVPYGGVETLQRYIIWPTTNKPSEMNVSGFSEASLSRCTLITTHRLAVHVVSIEFVVLLKLLAWMDRPRYRVKDAHHLCFILQSYDPVSRTGLVMEDNHVESAANCSNRIRHCATRIASSVPATVLRTLQNAFSSAAGVDSLAKAMQTCIRIQPPDSKIIQCMLSDFRLGLG